MGRRVWSDTVTSPEPQEPPEAGRGRKEPAEGGGPGHTFSAFWPPEARRRDRMNSCCFKPSLRQPSPSAGPRPASRTLTPHPVRPSASPALSPLPRPPSSLPSQELVRVTSGPEGGNSSSCKYRQTDLPKAEDRKLGRTPRSDREPPSAPSRLSLPAEPLLTRPPNLATCTDTAAFQTFQVTSHPYRLLRLLLPTRKLPEHGLSVPPLS